MSRLLLTFFLILAQDTLRVEVSLVTVAVRVTDSRGRDVRGLNAKDFSIFDDGVSQRIEYFAEAEQPLLLGIVLDRSDSMRYNDKLDRAKDAAAALIHDMPEGSEFFYIAFDDRVKLSADFTTNRDAITTAVRQTQSGGGTSLYDAILTAIEKTANARLERQALVIISDGTDQHSRRRLADVLKTVRQAKMQVYTIGYFSGNESELFRRSGARVELIDGTFVENPKYVLEKVAKESGAESFFPNDDRQLAKAIAEITKDLRTEYTVAFYPTAPDTDRYHQLRVTVRGGRYDVRAKPGYGAQP